MFVLFIITAAAVLCVQSYHTKWYNKQTMYLNSKLYIIYSRTTWSYNLITDKIERYKLGVELHVDRVTRVYDLCYFTLTKVLSAQNDLYIRFEPVTK